MDKKSVEAIRKRHDFFRPRLALHIINIIIQVVNLIVMQLAVESITNPDPQMAKFQAMRFRYLTTWVVLLHIFYSVSTLVLEVCPQMISSQGKGPNPQDPVEKFEFMMTHHEILFKGIIWPASLLVTVFFWSVFNYDRELIFPEFVDEVVSCVSNHIIHTWIAVFIFLEVVVHPRLRPRSSTLGHASAWRAQLILMVVYGVVFYFTVFSEGIWLYPIFSVAYQSGILNFLILHLLLLLLYLSTTPLFWWVNNRIHKERLWFKKQT